MSFSRSNGEQISEFLGCEEQRLEPFAALLGSKDNVLPTVLLLVDRRGL